MRQRALCVDLAYLKNKSWFRKEAGLLEVKKIYPIEETGISGFQTAIMVDGVPYCAVDSVIGRKCFKIITHLNEAKGI